MSFHRSNAPRPTSIRADSAPAPQDRLEPEDSTAQAGAVRNLRGHLRLLQGIRRSVPSIPAAGSRSLTSTKLPPLNSRPSAPVVVDEDGHEVSVGMPSTTSERRGLRMLQGIRRSTPQCPLSMDPMPEEVPITRPPPQMRRASSMKSKDTKRVRSSVDAMAAQACSMPKEEVKDAGRSSNDLRMMSHAASSETSVAKATMTTAHAQNDATQPDVAAQQAAAKQQAVMALQKLFFEELQKGADPNAAAAQALIRLNQKPIENTEAAQSVHDSIHVRPPTPLIGGPRGQMAIRVGIHS